MSAFDTARDVRLPGVVIENVRIDPKLLTPRMKNSVKKMLREGWAHGSWGSQSKQLALKLSETHAVQLIDSNKWGFKVPPRDTYGLEQLEELLRLVAADEALDLMDDVQRHGGTSHLRAAQDGTRNKHTRNRQTFTGENTYRWVRTFNRELAGQMLAVLTSSRPPHLRESAEKLCAMLDNNEPIPINISY
jgi:hypothetical protein